MKKIKAVLIGAGQRGNTYSGYALLYPQELEIVAVAEPDEVKKAKFGELHKIPGELRFSSWNELLSLPRLADAAMICTQDNMHLEPSIKAMEKGYHLLLEKPMSNKMCECIEIAHLAEKYGRIVSICHVLRYTPFFAEIKKLLEDGIIGKLISIQHNENVGFWHQAHSYVRGNWRNSLESSPMILAKSCHDMDILQWLAGADCSRLSSFGTLSHFKKENAPAGAPEKCLDGCPHEAGCPYNAARIYLNGNTGWPASVISNDTSAPAIEKALREGPYGRCVYHCDNNVVDHQVVCMEFENDVTAAFTMCAFTGEISRTIKLMGTKGEIRGVMEKNEIEITDFASGSKTVIHKDDTMSGHGGGDMGIMRAFASLLQQDNSNEGLTSARRSVRSHLMAFAAERSRLEKKVIDMNEYDEMIINHGRMKYEQSISG